MFEGVAKVVRRRMMSQLRSPYYAASIDCACRTDLPVIEMAWTKTHAVECCDAMFFINAV
jgi:hypothetical protein